MTALTIPEQPEILVETLTKNVLEQQAIDEAEALLIHKQLMMQYAETFERLAQ